VRSFQSLPIFSCLSANSGCESAVPTNATDHSVARKMDSELHRLWITSCSKEALLSSEFHCMFWLCLVGCLFVRLALMFHNWRELSEVFFSSATRSRWKKPTHPLEKSDTSEFDSDSEGEEEKDTISSLFNLSASQLVEVSETLTMTTNHQTTQFFLWIESFAKGNIS